MAITSHVDPAAGTGLIRISGVAAGSELAATIRALSEDPAWAGLHTTVWDCRRLRALAMTEADVAATVDALDAFRARLAPGRSAVVGPGEDEEIMARLLFRRARPHPTREFGVFTSAREAAAWLGLVPAQLDAG